MRNDEPRSLSFSEDDERRIALAVMAGDVSIAPAMWDRYSRLVRGVLRPMLGSFDVEDAVQETFVRFFRVGHRLAEPRMLKSFLLGVAYRVAASELRRRRVRSWITLTGTGTLPETPIEDPPDDAREALAHVARVLDGLESRSRMAFILRHLHGLELTAIADALDCSLATAKRLLAHAKERFELAAARDPVLSPYLSPRGSRGSHG